MKRPLWIFLMLALIGLGTLPLAQKKDVPTRVGFIDAETVIAAHPGYGKVKAVREQADKELAPLVEKLKSLEEKLQSGKATAKDRQDYQVLLEAYNKAKAKWAPKIQKALDPIVKEVDQVVAEVAKAQGFAVIMNRRVAAQSNLVVYADPSTDLTQAVVEALKKLK